MKTRILSILLCLVLAVSLLPAAALAADTGLSQEWQKDQDFTLADPAPWNLSELKQVVDVTDPRSVAAYWVWAVNRLVDDYDDGMEMMKYLFADIEPFGRGFTEGGMSGMAGWDSYFNERLSDPDYRWLPRAYFEGASAQNGFKPDRPLTIELYYNGPNTETINGQTLEQMGRLNIVYWVMSHAGDHQASITLSKFDGSDRWYVTNGTASTALFYDQRSAVSSAALALAGSTKGDDSTAAEHQKRYGGEEKENVFTDVEEAAYYFEAAMWAYNHEPQITIGYGGGVFGPKDDVNRGQVVTFLWRAAGEPEPGSRENPFVDVTEDDWFYKPVLWAVENKITAGIGDGKFGPDGTCSTAHIITFLYRAATGDTDGLGGWYEDATAWAEEAGLLDGLDITVSPEVKCPRADVVEFLFRQLAE